MSRLGGWWRLWVLVAAVLLGFSVFVALTSRDLRRDGSGSQSCVPGTTTNGARLETVWLKNPSYRDPIKAPTLGELLEPPPTRDKSADPLDRALQEAGKGNPSEPFLSRQKQIGTFECVSWGSLGTHLFFGALLALALLIAGFALKWVIKGFQK